MTTSAAPEPLAAPTPVPTRQQPRIGLEWVALAAIVVTAFFLASVPARNGSLFGYLAAGRDFAADPTWLFNIGAYFGERLTGTVGLVVLKSTGLAAFVTLSVWAVLRTGAPLRAAVYCAVPAIFAIATFTAVEPAALTPAFFAATLVLLLPEGAYGEPPPRRAWLVVPLFVAWAGSAEYVLLGPVTVACLAVSAARPGRLAWAALAAVSLAAAFACPDPLRALRLPGLTRSPLADVFRSDGWAGVPAPTSRRFWTPDAGYAPVAVALGLSILVPALALARRGARRSAGLSLVWGFALLAALAHWWAIPLAACAGAVVTGAALGPTEAASLRRRRSDITGGLLILVWAVAMPLAAWAGWLQPAPYATRQWRVDPDPSLREAADALSGWEWPGPARAFVFSPEAGDHLAWLSPGQRPALTTTSVTRPIGADHAAVVRALSGTRPVWDEDGRAVLRRLGTTHLVLFHPDAGRFNRALGTLLNRPDEFPPLWWRGRVVIFGWRDPARAGGPDTFPGVRLDLSPNPTSADWRSPAPESPIGPPRPWSWRDALSRPPAARTADRDEAATSLVVFDFQRQQAEATAPYGFEALELAGLVAASATGPGIGEMPVRAQMALAIYGVNEETGRAATPFVALGLAHRRGYLTVRGFGPIGTLLRGVRAGRRAIAANPQDAAAYQSLAECYLRLRRFTRESRWADAFPTVGRIRAAQAAYAGRQALRINPDLPAAHAILADLFGEAGFADAALRHARELSRLRRTAGPAPGEDAEQFADRLKFLDAEAEQYEQQVRRAEDALATLKSPSVAQRAAVALANGLGEKALAMLLETDVAAFGPEGAKLELGLLLDLGRADEAREWLTPDYRRTVGPVPYHAFRAQAAAAVGDYSAADDELALLARASDLSGLPDELVISRFVGQVVLDGAVLDELPAGALIREANQAALWANAVRAQEHLRITWGLGAQRAWLMLERGDYAGAERWSSWALHDAGSMGFPGRPLAEGVRAVVQGGP